MVTVRFSGRGGWLTGLRHWKDQMAEPWACIEILVQSDPEGLHWSLWFQATALVGESLWLVQERIGRCHDDAEDAWNELKAESQAILDSVRSTLTAAGIPVVRAAVNMELPRHG